MKYDINNEPFVIFKFFLKIRWWLNLFILDKKKICNKSLLSLMQNESKQKNIQANLINDSQPKKKKKGKKKNKQSWSNNNYKIGLKKLQKLSYPKEKKKKNQSHFF